VRAPGFVPFGRRLGHTDAVAAPVPAPTPSRPPPGSEGAPTAPPIRLWDQGVPNRSVLTIMTRNSRMPESLAADLDAECAACLMGAARIAELFERYGTGAVGACFDAIVAGTTATFRREILAKIPVGTWT